MKLILSICMLLLVQYAFTQQNNSGYQALSGKKIKSVIQRETNPAGSANTKSMTVGGTTITSGSASAKNTVNRELQFKASGDAIELERKFNRIITRTVNPLGEMVVDSDNPFERPAPMAKLGEKYDYLVKQRAVTKYSNGVAAGAGISNEFSLAWNEYLPYLSLDSALNITYLPLPADRRPGTVWLDSANTTNLSLTVQYTIQEVKGDTVVVKCEGLNRYNPPKATGNTINANIYKLQSVFQGTLKADARNGLIHNATFTALTQTRKLALGQEMDSEVKEQVTVQNTIQ